MVDQNQIDEEFQHAIEWRREDMPKDIRELIDNANSDLYSGPLYLDSDGEPCSLWDDGATPFNFTEACDKIRNYLSDIDDLTVIDLVEPESEDDAEWIEIEIKIEDSAEEIRKALVGRELYSYVR